MRNVKSILFSLLAVVVTALLMTSCEQETLIDEVSIENSLLDNDILKFNNIEAFIDYYEQLNMLYDEDDQEFNRLAEAIAINTVHKKRINDVYENPEDRYQPFLIDPIMRAISNEHFEFQIADVLLTQVTNDFMMVSDVNDVATRMELRNMTKGDNLSINTIPAKAYPVTDDNVSTLLGPWSVEGNYNQAEVMNSIRAINNRSGNNGCIVGPGSVSNFYIINSKDALEARTKTYNNWCCTYEFSEVTSKQKVSGNWVTKPGFVFLSIRTKRRKKKNCNYKHDEYQFKDGYYENKSVRISTATKPGHKDNDIKGSYQKTVFDYPYLLDADAYITF